MAFVNRVRLPFKLTRPQFLEEADVFRKGNGQIKVIGVVIRKQYEGETDLWPEKWHERFKIAIRHDTVTVEGEKYIGGIVQDGDYTINWVDFLDYPIAKASFKVLATPFDASNTNCGICSDDFIQVVANDDNVGTVEENTSVDVDVLSNDAICCDPVELTIITYNTTYVQSLTIINGNTLHIVLKDNLVSQNNVVLATYRVQCEDGQFDEANVIGNISGSIESDCDSPLGLAVIDVTDTSVQLDWGGILGAESYNWSLYLATNLVNPVNSGNVIGSNVTINGLLPDTDYVFFVQTVCADGTSNFAQIPFTTDEADCDENCGRYRLTMDDGSGNTGNTVTVWYTDCNGDLQSQIVPNENSTFICALQNTPGDAVYISPVSSVTIEYMGLCCSSEEP